MSESPLAKLFRERNSATVGNATLFESHRQRIIAVCNAATDNSRSEVGTACVLGAGNCNDLDLTWWSSNFANTVLVDLDEPAVRSGVERQGSPPNLEVQSGDVTGMLEWLAAQPTAARTTGLLIEAAKRLERPPPLLVDRTFDLVLSTCLLSQLVDGLKSAIGEAHPQFVPLVQKLRRQHLNWMLDLTAPGGHAVLVFDYVSSETVPTLASVSDSELGQMTTTLLHLRNFFTGLNPQILLQDAATSPLGNRLQIAPRLEYPWRWNLGPRIYLVSALVMRKKGSVAIFRPKKRFFRPLLPAVDAARFEGERRCGRFLNLSLTLQNLLYLAYATTAQTRTTT